MLDQVGRTGASWLPVRGGTEAAPALTPQELAQAEQLARRLHAELRGVISLLPEHQRGASAMARVLGVDRVTCQRIVAIAARVQVGPESLVQLPGIQGLRQFVAAMAAHKRGRGPAEQLAAAGAAIDRFQGLIEQLGGSQRRLRARLSASNALAAPMDGGAEDPSTREALFRAAAAITGRWSATLLDVRIIRPVPGQPLLTEGARVRGMIGHVSRPDAVPLETGDAAPLRVSDPAGPAFSALDADGRQSGWFLEPFCSLPLPQVTSRSGGDAVVHVLDTGGSTPQRPLDVVISQRGAQPDRHPATLSPAVGEMMSLVNFPGQRLVFDVYLHRGIARCCIPSLELHLWAPDGGRRWSTRFPGGPRLELLGTGLQCAGTPAYARQSELLGHTFDQLGWNPEEFIGYRCEVLYPVWRAGYCMVFDFTGNEMAGPADDAGG